MADATYTIDSDGTTYTIEYSTGLTSTVSAGIKTENDKIVADAAKLINWPQLKAEFVKVIDEIIADAKTLADNNLKLAQDAITL